MLLVLNHFISYLYNWTKSFWCTLFHISKTIIIFLVQKINEKKYFGKYLIDKLK